MVRPVSVLPLASFNVTTACVDCPTVRLLLLSVTVTDATGTGVTVRVAEPEMPSLMAVIVVVPAATDVTKPVLETAAMLVLLLANVMVRPVSTLPLASLSTTTAWVVCPAVRLLLFSVTVTEATGTGVTVTVAEPEVPSLVAVIVAVPTAIAVTRPVLETVAMPVLLLA